MSDEVRQVHNADSEVVRVAFLTCLELIALTSVVLLANNVSDWTDCGDRFDLADLDCDFEEGEFLNVGIAR